MRRAVLLTVVTYLVKARQDRHRKQRQGGFVACCHLFSESKRFVPPFVVVNVKQQGNLMLIKFKGVKK